MEKVQQIGVILSLIVTTLIPLNTNAGLFHFIDSRIAIEFKLSPQLGEIASNAELNSKSLFLSETHIIPSARGSFDSASKHALFVVDSENQFLDSSGFRQNHNEIKFTGVISDAANFLTHENIDLSVHVLTNPTFYSDIELSLPPIGVTGIIN